MLLLKEITFFIFLLSPFPIYAADIKTDTCLEKCSIDKDPTGMQRVRCSCSKNAPPQNYWGNGKNGREISFLRDQLKGISLETYQKIKNGGCNFHGNTYQTKNIEDAKNLLSVTTKEICECVEQRTKYPLAKACFKSVAGENFCEFRLKQKLMPSPHPIRKVALFDYQVCEAKKNNYRRPESCLEAECKVKLSSCSAGYELTNIADSGACCPQFFCKKIDQVLSKK